jgi:hypothetical protein
VGTQTGGGPPWHHEPGGRGAVYIVLHLRAIAPEPERWLNVSEFKLVRRFFCSRETPYDLSLEKLGVLYLRQVITREP